MALPTSGRVVIETTVGDIEIELWAKVRCFPLEAIVGPLNRVTGNAKNMQKLPGFSDGRQVIMMGSSFTGDRTGTGFGGESFYGDNFEDEIHPRLRFAHRGLVAMANNGTKNSNDSQFFITLGKFGYLVADVLKIGQLELGENERPLYPPKIKTVRIVEDPFGDIIPRITAAEKRAQQLAKEASQRQREEAIRKKGAKKQVNVALLSFGDDAEAQDEPVVFTKKSLSRPDLVENPGARAAISALNVPEPPKPRAKSTDTAPAASPSEPEATSKPHTSQEGEIASIRKKHKSEKDAKKDSQKTELEKMEAQVRKLARRHSDSESDGEREAKKPKGPSQLELELAKYKKGRTNKKGKGKGRDESDMLAALSTFRGRLQQSMGEDQDDEDVGMQDVPPKEDKGGEQGEENLLEVDDDSSWIGHRLRFAKDDGTETRRAEHEYEVIDPRARGNQARMEERERKAGKRSAVGQAFQKGGR
ncbi:Peptidyl-prolyl isomerase cwc27 [Ceratobasidium sp. 370]|nr:Peptidyl-prolyl isomerase cwc27 [Ceratobasidium sp. 370]